MKKINDKILRGIVLERDMYEMAYKYGIDDGDIGMLYDYDFITREEYKALIAHDEFTRRKILGEINDLLTKSCSACSYCPNMYSCNVRTMYAKKRINVEANRWVKFSQCSHSPSTLSDYYLQLPVVCAERICKEKGYSLRDFENKMCGLSTRKS